MKNNLKSLEALANDAIENVESGFYRVTKPSKTARKSLRRAISENRGRAIICEVKYASPSSGEIRHKGLPSEIAKEMEAGGATGLSVLTEPKNFRGSISNLASVRAVTSLPIIMKDIIVAKEQIVAAAQLGASAVLFIEEIFTRKQTKGLTLDEAIMTAEENGLDSIVETHTKKGLEIVANSGCDIIGLNNRDLDTFTTDLGTTAELLKGFSLKERNNQHDLPIIMSESGFENPEDIIKLRERIRLNSSIQPDAFLIGTSIMKSKNIADKVLSFTKVLNG